MSWVMGQYANLKYQFKILHCYILYRHILILITKLVVTWFVISEL